MVLFERKSFFISAFFLNSNRNSVFDLCFFEVPFHLMHLIYRWKNLNPVGTGVFGDRVSLGVGVFHPPVFIPLFVSLGLSNLAHT